MKVKSLPSKFALSASVRPPILILMTILAGVLLSACDSDLETRAANSVSDPSDNPSGNPADNPSDTPGGQPEPPPGSGFTIRVGSEPITLNEGGAPVSIPIVIERATGATEQIQLAVQPGNGQNLDVSLVDATITADETTTSIDARMFIGARPLLPHDRTITIIGTDTQGATAQNTVTLNVAPTTRPDIYLLIGQSNMVGSSEENAKASQPGQPDAIDPRIMQLNVTGNDNTFSTAADFTDPTKLYNNGQPLTPALDPLHQGFEGSGTKAGTRIGLGLSFAKAALADTTANIFLVPAAWSDTGFCVRNSHSVEGMGWNATQKTVSELSGTLLHDRAIARTNATISETGGILRGILWHQGEADTNNTVCASTYQDNLHELVGSLRSNIDQDARGSQARAIDADIPFIAGTMSMGGDQAPFSDDQNRVDATHRTISTFLSHADFVNADDLVPPSFPCGAGSCIHFGADAYRELGKRYYDVLNSVLP